MRPDQGKPDDDRAKPDDDEDRFSLAATYDFSPDERRAGKWGWVRIVSVAAIAVTLVAGIAAILGGAPDGKRIAAAGQIIDEDEFAAEWAWVQDRMGLSGLPVPPVVMASNLLPILGRPTTDGTHIVAGLSFGGVVILNERNADLDSLEFRGQVVHEFVHQVQYAKGLSGCGLERDAHRLQNEWLAERGLPPYADAGGIERAVEQCEGG